MVDLIRELFQGDTLSIIGIMIVITGFITFCRFLSSIDIFLGIGVFLIVVGWFLCVIDYYL